MQLRPTAAFLAALATLVFWTASPAQAAPLGAAIAASGAVSAANVTPESLVADLPTQDGAAGAFRRAGAAFASLAPSFATGPIGAQEGAPSDAAAKLTGWQCAQFARLFTGIQIFGDAWTWWSQAVGKYARGFSPQAGSVLVFRPYGAMRLGHVAVVSQVLTDRIIQVTHANWSLLGGRRGQVEKDVTVVDVSAAGDWSQVKVWYDPKGDLGTTIYPTYGFIYKALDAMTHAAASVGGASPGGAFASAR